MEIYALDKSFNLITIGIPYGNLQWTRRYYEPGEFMLQLPLGIYDESWAYIGTNARPELGMVQKIQESGEGEATVVLSGFFCEKMLDDKVCFPRYRGDVSHTETAVRSIFTRYKDDLPIALAPANSPLLGDRTQSDFSDDQMGDKLYRILESRECSLRVRYDFVNGGLTLGVWKGLDRTQSQFVNPSQVFSAEFGNLIGKNISIDESGVKNYAYIPVNANDSGAEQDTFILDWSNGGYKKEIVFDMRAESPEDGHSYASFRDGILQDAAERLLSYAAVNDITIQIADNAGYMVDYDLGDKCDVLLSDVGIKMETRIVEVLEVFKADDGHTIAVGLGNRRIDNIRRAVMNA